MPSSPEQNGPKPALALKSERSERAWAALWDPAGLGSCKHASFLEDLSPTGTLLPGTGQEHQHPCPPRCHEPPSLTWLSATVRVSFTRLGLFWAGRACCTSIPTQPVSPQGATALGTTPPAPRGPTCYLLPFLPSSSESRINLWGRKGLSEHTGAGHEPLRGQGEGGGQSLQLVLGVQAAPEKKSEGKRLRGPGMTLGRAGLALGWGTGTRPHITHWLPAVTLDSWCSGAALRERGTG